ncbi:MAG: hypothetical protein ACF8R7_05865, partial [Phycisphaerales bacterium JB039]
MLYPLSLAALDSSPTGGGGAAGRGAHEGSEDGGGGAAAFDFVGAGVAGAVGQGFERGGVGATGEDVG